MIWTLICINRKKQELNIVQKKESDQAHCKTAIHLLNSKVFANEMNSTAPKCSWTMVYMFVTPIKQQMKQKTHLRQGR